MAIDPVCMSNRLPFPTQALSKKEEEMMHKTQARIERELKANQAKTLRIRGERPIFGLSDLLSSFDQQEG